MLTRKRKTWRVFSGSTCNYACLTADAYGRMVLPRSGSGLERLIPPHVDDQEASAMQIGEQPRSLSV